MLTGRQAKQILTKGRMLALILVVIAGCRPGSTGTVATPVPTNIAGETAVATEATPTPAATMPAATATPLPIETNTAGAPTVTTTDGVVAPAEVQYVMALADLDLRSGPDLGASIVGRMASGQIAEVSGVSTDGAWWQLVCPGNTATHCWVSADSQHTQTRSAATRIQFVPGATSETITGSMDGENQVNYVLAAAAGQTMVISVTSPNDGVLFHLQGLGDGHVYKHLLDGELSWQGVLPQAQDYLLVLDAVGGATTYTLTVSISDEPAGGEIPGGPLYPVVDGKSGYLLGGTQNGQWVDAQTYATYLQDTERPYSVYTLAGYQGQVTGSPPVTPGGVCSQPVVALHPPDGASGAVALVATWEAAPRLAQALPTDTAVYREAVAALLVDQGLAEPEVQIESIYRIDLEGDGVDEVLITASRLLAGTSAPAVAAGDYAMVVLRKVVDGSVVPIPLVLDVYPKANDLAYPFHYRILGLLDLNGNGRLEIMVEADRYEGSLVMVYELTASGADAVLQAGCVQ